MAQLNKVILAGNLTRDCELKYVGTKATAIVKCGVAVNRAWKGEDGQKKEEAMFIDFQIWGPQAETFQKYTHKGSCVLLEGALRLEQWTEAAGGKPVTHSKHTLNVERYQFLDSAPKGETHGK